MSASTFVQIKLKRSAVADDLDFVKLHCATISCYAFMEQLVSIALRARSYAVLDHLFGVHDLSSAFTKEMMQVACTMNDRRLLQILNIHLQRRNEHLGTGECLCPWQRLSWYRADRLQECLFYAIENHLNETLAFLVCDVCVDVNVLSTPTRRFNSFTPLCASILHCNYRAFYLLLQKGADVLKAAPNSGSNAFDAAAHYEEKTMLYDLINKSDGAWRQYEPKRHVYDLCFDDVLRVWQKEQLLALCVSAGLLSPYVIAKVAEKTIASDAHGLSDAEILCECTKLRKILLQVIAL